MLSCLKVSFGSSKKGSGDCSVWLRKICWSRLFMGICKMWFMFLFSSTVVCPKQLLFYLVTWPGWREFVVTQRHARGEDWLKHLARAWQLLHCTRNWCSNNALMGGGGKKTGLIIETNSRAKHGPARYVTPSFWSGMHCSLYPVTLYESLQWQVKGHGRICASNVLNPLDLQCYVCTYMTC